jgi:hypothetical protein
LALGEVVLGGPSQDWTDETASGDSPWFYRVEVLP